MLAQSGLALALDRDRLAEAAGGRHSGDGRCVVGAPPRRPAWCMGNDQAELTSHPAASKISYAMGTLAQSCSPQIWAFAAENQTPDDSHVHMRPPAPTLHHQASLDQGRQVQRRPRSDKHRTSQACGKLSVVRPPISGSTGAGARSGHITVRHLLPLNRFITHTRAKADTRAVIAWLDLRSPLTNRKRLVFAGIAHACLSSQRSTAVTSHASASAGQERW